MNRDKFRRPSERELQEELAQEMEWAALHKKSVEGWMSIIRGIEAETEKGLDDESEWKTRYNFQTLYNASLRRQVKKMRGEVRLLRNGVALVQVSADMDRMSTAGCRQHVKHLKTELLSLKGLCTSYDHQLDEEAAGYTRAQEEIHSIVNDVGFRQAIKIEKQETLDKSLPPIGARPRTLHHAQDRLINAQSGSGIAPNIQQRPISIRPRLDDTTYFHYRKQEKLPPMKPKSLQSKSSYLEMYEKTKAKRQKKCQPKSATKRVHFRDPV